MANQQIRRWAKDIERDKLFNELIAALEHAVEWMDEDGCDCGTDEPGTCGLCHANRALKKVKES